MLPYARGKVNGEAFYSTDSYAIPVQVKVSRDTDQRYLLGSGSACADVLKLNTLVEGSYCVVATLSNSDGYILDEAKYYFILQQP